MTSMTQLRLAAALAHSSVDSDLEVVTGDDRWIVSYRRARATTNPCGFRHLVLAAMRGVPLTALPPDDIRFVGGLRDIGAGIYERHGPAGPERHLATLLPPAKLRALLAGVAVAVDGVEAKIGPDEDLGVSTLALTAAHPASELHLDVVAHAVAASCLVEELIGADRAWAG